ncbi:cysteine--tRNA ligase, chloroplastic/mitochondrial isoform X2 [Cryptomeria japonica]|uniref:cysteine--tRNA ligase, chloroplastic/mitochondrial isoform X2 n=1 Tax=Cryptomeria japonica TaxID=3369 RepID=UPI0027DA57F4|nr:cysteine--tRNA ligase, chloroplastic/mitochondrial isoform X2 [Cryptomeria japonica]
MNLSALQARPGLRAKAAPLIKFFQSYSPSFSFQLACQPCSRLRMETPPSHKSSAPSSKIRAFCSNKGKNGGFEESKKNKETELYLFNTASRQKELFKPREPGKVGMYVCGVTAYDFSHIGHARVYVTFDILYRYLKHLGYEVKYVRNFTDIDDKIIARANETGENPLSLSNRFCKEFCVDMEKLYCLPPSVEPRVTEHISEIIEMIQKILTNGYAYVVENGDVYFSVDKYPEYGCLSGRKLDDNRAGERVAVDSRKQNPADFALWKSAKPGEPCWESPWGQGRPGWHIECSAMSATHLGYSFDIHGGGVDLIFPHHENELAQSCTACKESSVRYWMHNGFVTIDAEKMSKSLGNFFTIREVLESYHPLALRVFLSGTHYRSPVNYSKSHLESASDRIFYIYQTLKDSEECLSGSARENIGQPVPSNIVDCINKIRVTFTSSMSDDLHAHIVLAALSEPLRIMNDLMFTRQVKKLLSRLCSVSNRCSLQGIKQKSRIESLAALEEEVRAILSVLGLTCPNCSEVLLQLKEMALKRAGLSEDELEQAIKERSDARAAKNYAESDKIRKKLAVIGIALMDGPSGTTWRPAIPLEEEEQHVAT